MLTKISKNVVGFVLIDAPHSALNMGQADPNEADENKIPVKFVRRGREVYPYVSAQAWRYWWRNTLESRFGWKMSGITYLKGKNVAYTQANPFAFPDDDVFGYMRATKKDGETTLTRLSPLKTSPLLSVVPQKPTEDYGVMARQEDFPSIHQHQFYSTVFKGIFSLDLSSVGVFYESARTGFRNIEEKHLSKDEIKKAIEESQAQKEDKSWKLPNDTRAKRASETIKALPFLSGGAKQTLHLTDVTPKFIVLAIIKGGNHLFMNIAANDPNKLISITALQEIITDYKDEILSDVFIGRQEGFQDNLKSPLEELKAALADTKPLHLLSPKQAVEKFVEEIPKHID